MSYILLTIIIYYIHIYAILYRIFFSSSNDDYMIKSLLHGEWLAEQALSQLHLRDGMGDKGQRGRNNDDFT